MANREKRGEWFPHPRRWEQEERFREIISLARRLIRAAKRVTLRLSKKKLLW
jgi:hypothetical protein